MKWHYLWSSVSDAFQFPVRISLPHPLFLNVHAPVHSWALRKSFHGVRNPLFWTGALGIAKLEGNCKETRQPFANPLPTFRQPFANLFCQPLSKPLFPWTPGAGLEMQVNGFLVICAANTNTQPRMPAKQPKERRGPQKKQLNKEEDQDKDREAKTIKKKYWPQIEAKEAMKIKQPHQTIKHVHKESQKHKTRTTTRTRTTTTETITTTNIVSTED